MFDIEAVPKPKNRIENHIKEIFPNHSNHTIIEPISYLRTISTLRFLTSIIKSLHIACNELSSWKEQTSYN